MGRISIFERFRVHSAYDPEKMQFGIMEFDLEKCTGCSMCADVCPADSIALVDKKPEMRPASENGCAFCGDCVALCPAGAVTMKKPYSFEGFYKTIDRGKDSPPRL